MCNMTLRCFRVTIIDSSECVCVRVSGCGCTGAGVCLRASSLTIPAINAPPYCHLRPLWLHHIFRLYLINGTIFGKVTEHKICVFIFYTVSV
jgi:hypothetical protein